MEKQPSGPRLIELAGGAIMEQLDKEAAAIAENINDPNTDWKAIRKLTVTFTLKPTNEGRQVIDVTAQAKATLAPRKPIMASLAAAQTSAGIRLREIGRGVDPGQVTFTDIQQQEAGPEGEPGGEAEEEKGSNVRQLSAAGAGKERRF